MLFKMHSQVGAAGFNDSPGQHNMDEIGFNVVQYSLIMGDDQNTQIRPIEGVYTVGDYTQCIDIQSGIGH